MLKKVLSFLGIHYYSGWCTLYTGRGYIQGIGFDIDYKSFELGRLKIITNIRFSVDSEWMRNLRHRIVEDEKQMMIEKKRAIPPPLLSTLTDKI